MAVSAFLVSIDGILHFYRRQNLFIAYLNSVIFSCFVLCSCCLSSSLTIDYKKGCSLSYLVPK